MDQDDDTTHWTELFEKCASSRDTNICDKILNAAKSQALRDLDFQNEAFLSSIRNGK